MAPIISSEIKKNTDTELNGVSNQTECTTLLLLPLKDLANNNFIIGSYQRGYKWGKKEVLELLNDINAFDGNQGLYCLQPIILKALNFDNGFEVIDGQQRTTTIYLLLEYLIFLGYIDSDCRYVIDFQTRKRSGEFLKYKLDDLFIRDVALIQRNELELKDYDDLKAIHQLWESFITDFRDYDNVDVYHFFVVTSYIKAWISIYLSEESIRKQFIQKLLYQVNVIWYRLDDTQSHEEVIRVFLNNNKGKIRLTSSELIKALCILEIKNSEIATLAELKINQFAVEWDFIEKQLQDDRFWYFLQPDESKYKQGTRIDFLFDLYFEKRNIKDNYYAYREVEAIFNDETKILIDVWESIVQLYYKLLNWYQDTYLYHFVGFITNANILTLDEVLVLSKGINKEAFANELENQITTKFTKKVLEKESEKEIFVYDLENLHYKKYYNETLQVLLLYNVLYYIGNMASYKFPFDLFVQKKWSIEHINPQNPQDFEDISIYVQWVQDLLAYIGEGEDKELVNLILSKKDIDDLHKDNDLKKRIDSLVIDNQEATHAIQNLLLLDKNTNSSLGNRLFGDKRNKVLEFDEKGVNDDNEPIFIPIETLNAFNKTFSSKVNIENWTKEDGDNYVSSIEKRLLKYLPKI